MEGEKNGVNIQSNVMVTFVSYRLPQSDPSHCHRYKKYNKIIKANRRAVVELDPGLFSTDRVGNKREPPTPACQAFMA